MSKTKEQQIEYQKNWYKNNKQKVNNNTVLWRKQNPDKFKEYSWKNHLKKKYNITPELYDKMLKNQNGLCLICQKPETFIEPKGTSNELRRLCVDHDHKTGKIRGLLCSRCNKSIGQMEDSPSLLRIAAKYLEDSNA